MLRGTSKDGESRVLRWFRSFSRHLSARTDAVHDVLLFAIDTRGVADVFIPGPSEEAFCAQDAERHVCATRKVSFYPLAGFLVLNGRV